MNGKKAKAIRRALGVGKGQEAEYRYDVTAHPFVALNGERNVRYRFRVISTGWRRLYKIMKRIYNTTGVLPMAPRTEEAKS